MVSTYVNDLRLNELATGDGSGTWGDTTNTNLELIGEALSFGTEAITTNADTHTSTVADGATDPARSMYIKYTGTLDSACTITIAPNTLSRLHFIENGTSGSQNIIIKQGSGATVTIGPGDVKAVYLDGAGSGAAVVDAFASLSVVDLKVGDDLTVSDDLLLNSDDAVISFGADADVKITHDPDDGLFFKSTATGDDNPFVLTIQTGETDIAQDDKLGVINFQAPDEGAGTDAILVAAGIEAIAEGDFAADSNATSLVFKTGASAAAAEQARIDSAGRVQVNATDGTEFLNVNGAIGSKGASSNFSAGPARTLVDFTGSLGRVGTVNGTGSATPLTFITNNGEVARFQTDGDLLIGTTTGTYDERLLVNLSSSEDKIGAFFFAQNTSYTKTLVRAQSNTTSVGGNYKYFEGMSFGGAVNFHVKSDGSGYFAGEVNIGTSTSVSGYQLQVTNSSGSVQQLLKAGANFNSTIAFGDPDSNTAGQVLYAHNGDQLRFHVAGASTANVLIDSNGTLIINDTARTLACRQHVAFAGNGEQGIVVENTQNNQSGAAVRFVDSDGDFSGGGIFFQDSNSVTYATGSDYRLKENAVSLTNATDRLKQIPVYRFNFKKTPSTTVDGFMAHEVQAIVPESVIGTKDEVDEDGNAVYQKIDQSKLVPLLVATIKELEARITALES